jgi:hypothetical protein
MQRKVFRAVMSIAVLSLLACGGGGSYSDAIEVNQDFVDAMEHYLDGIEKADSGSSMAGVINDYADRIDKLAPRMKEIAAKYPEWKDHSKIPEALKPLSEKAESLSNRMAGSFMKAMKYMQDPDVQAAQKRLADSMMKMQ